LIRGWIRGRTSGRACGRSPSARHDG
jgi:hypothetical protein